MLFSKEAGDEMNTIDFLRDVTRLPGLPGHEHEVAAHVAEAFKPLADAIAIDPMNNVVARCGNAGPKILVAAHMDEIGLVVRGIEEDGALRLRQSGGVDPRILPAAEVKVWTKTGPLMGFIGAKAPHLLNETERMQATKLDDVYVDLGMPAEMVKEKVRFGDMVTLVAPMTALANGRYAGKTMDDRAGVAAMLVAAEELGKLKHGAQALFAATTQEEVGMIGAKAAGFSQKPDAAIAVDVTHGAGPGTGKWEAHPIDRLVIDRGPNINPELFRRLQKTAKDNGIDVNVGISNGRTHTDADALDLSNAGVPSVLISIPLRYMHTTVETLDAQMIEQCGKLMALFIRDIAADWGDISWY